MNLRSIKPRWKEEEEEKEENSVFCHIASQTFLVTNIAHVLPKMITIHSIHMYILGEGVARSNGVTPVSGIIH